MNKIQITENQINLIMGLLACVVAVLWFWGLGILGLIIAGVIILITFGVLTFKFQTPDFFQAIPYQTITPLIYVLSFLTLIPAAIYTITGFKGLIILTLVYILFVAWYFSKDENQAWWEYQKTKAQKTWKRWEEIRVWGIFFKNVKFLIVFLIVVLAVIYSWTHQPLGFLIPLLTAYTLWRINKEINPGVGLGSGWEEGVVYRHYWTGFFYLAVKRNPVLSLLGILWVCLTLVSPFMVEWITARLSLTPRLISAWFILGAFLMLFWIRWAIGPWRRSGFIISESEKRLIQCIPSKYEVKVKIRIEKHPILSAIMSFVFSTILSFLAELIIPIETIVASMDIARIAHAEGENGSFGGRKYDPGLQFQEGHEAAEKLAGDCVDPKMISDINKIIDKNNN